LCALHTPPLPLRRFACPEPGCGKHFYEHGHLARHAALHQRARPHVCQHLVSVSGGDDGGAGGGGASSGGDSSEGMGEGGGAAGGGGGAADGEQRVCGVAFHKVRASRSAVGRLRPAASPPVCAL
jgi:hypothetical protein